MKVILYIVLLFSFIPPNLISKFNSISKIYYCFQALSIFYVFIKFIFNGKISKIILLALLMQCSILFSTFINKGDCISVIINSIQTLTFCMLIELLIKKDIKTLFLSLSIILYILIFIDFIYVLIYPNGIRIDLYSFWFLGTKNNHITYIIPAIFCNYINDFVLCKKSRKFSFSFTILYIMCFYILLTVKSSTSIVVLGLLLILSLFGNNIKMQYINISYIILFLSIICFQIQNLFSFFIEDILHKDLTFTGRVQIWNDAINYIFKSPLWGYGDESNAVRAVKFNYVSALHCHNMILELTYRGGIILISLFLVFWNEICKNINKRSKSAIISKHILIVYCVALLMEVFDFEVLLWVLVLIYYTIKFSKEEETAYDVTIKKQYD